MRSRVALAVAALLVLAAGIGGALWWRQREAEQDAAAEAAVTAYVAGWSAKDLDAVPFADDATQATSRPPSKDLGDAQVEVTAGDVDARRRHGDDRARRHLDPARRRAVDVCRAGPRRRVGRPLGGGGPGTGRSPWHPDLARRRDVRARADRGARGDLLDRDGQPLMPLGTVHAVQLDPVNATPASAAGLEAVVGATKGSLVDALAKATASGSKAPIPVITYRDADYASAPGPARGAPRRHRPDVGAAARPDPHVRPAAARAPTARSRPRWSRRATAATSPATGPAAAACRRSTTPSSPARPGSPSPRAATGAPSSRRRPPTAPTSSTTLSRRAGRPPRRPSPTRSSTVPAALVAVDVPSGEVLAAANSRPPASTARITGRYPPGSTFKVATTLRLPHPRHHDADRRRCPAPRRSTVDGREFRNYAGRVDQRHPDLLPGLHGLVQHRVRRAVRRLGDDDLDDRREALGIGAGWADSVGVDGRLRRQRPGDDRRHGCRGGRHRAGPHRGLPAALAVMAGSVGRGTFVPPVLVAEAGASTPRPSPLDGGAVAQLRVDDGLGRRLRHRHRAARGTPGGPVRGKTGTAEHGSDPDAAPRVWFVGYQGDVAFAVLVEEGRSGGTVAAPIARDFLTEPGHAPEPLGSGRPRPAIPDGAFGETRGTRVRWGGPGRPADPWGPG